jgi:hypothetical protein
MADHVAIMSKLGWERIRPTRTGAEIESMISALERMVGAELPTDYRLFLTRYGGVSLRGYVCANLIEPMGTEQRVVVEKFFGFLNRKENGQPDYLDFDYQWDLFPNYSGQKRLPIARGIGRDRVCISLAGHDRDFVYYWDGEHIELGKDGLEKVCEVLDRHGIDYQMMEQDEMIFEAEKFVPGLLGRPPGYSNLYLIAR